MHSDQVLDALRTHARPVLREKERGFWGVTTPKATGPLAERRVVRRIQDIERLPRRQKEILLSTIDSFLRGATASR